MVDASAELYLDLLKKCLSAYLYDESAWQAFGTLVLNNQTLQLPPGVMVVQCRPFNPLVRELGRDWPLFGYSMVGLRRLDNLVFCLDEILKNDVPGDVIETGVWRGGCTILMRAVLKVRGVSHRKVWVADSFQGLPPKGPLDVGNQDLDQSSVGYLKVTLEQVQANFRRFGLLDEQVCFLKGWFKDTLAKAPIDRLAVFRLDGDMYESTIDALRGLYHKVSPGGFVIVDDFYSNQGCHQAIVDFRTERGINSEMQPIDRDAIYWKVEAK